MTDTTKSPDPIKWSVELQARLMACVDEQEPEIASLMGEAACLLAHFALLASSTDQTPSCALEPDAGMQPAITQAEHAAIELDAMNRNYQALMAEYQKIKYRKRELETEVSDLRRTLDSLRVRDDSAKGAGTDSQQGWKLVPIEPTKDMIEAGDNAGDDIWTVESAYEAMIAAAPVSQPVDAQADNLLTIAYLEGAADARKELKYATQALELARHTLIAAQPRNIGPEGWRRHHEAIDAVNRALHHPATMKEQPTTAQVSQRTPNAGLSVADDTPTGKE